MANANSIQEINHLITEAKRRIFSSFQECQIIIEKIDNIMENNVENIEYHVINNSIWNDLGLFFMNKANDYCLSQKTYRHMLKTICKIEVSRGITLHKGLALFNLGLSQIRMNNFDEGIPNVLEAYEEDIKNAALSSKANKLSASLLKDDIISFLISNVDANYFATLVANLPTNSISTNTLASLFSKLQEDEQLFLARIFISYKTIPFRNDIYSKIIRYDNLRNIYLLIELLLKRRKSTTLPKKKETLGWFISDVFANEQPWESIFSANIGLSNFNKNSNPLSSLTQFVSNFNSLYNRTIALAIPPSAQGFNREDEFLARFFLLAVLMRNYTSHFFDDYAPILNNQKTYQSLFSSAVHMLIYSLK
jgi:hypothetical protein